MVTVHPENKKAESAFPDSALYEITKHGCLIENQRPRTKFSTDSSVVC